MVFCRIIDIYVSYATSSYTLQSKLKSIGAWASRSVKFFCRHIFRGAGGRGAGGRYLSELNPCSIFENRKMTHLPPTPKRKVPQYFSKFAQMTPNPLSPKRKEPKYFSKSSPKHPLPIPLPNCLTILQSLRCIGVPRLLSLSLAKAFLGHFSPKICNYLQLYIADISKNLSLCGKY